MGARLRAKRLASDLELIPSSGSLPVQPGISGPGQEPTFVLISDSRQSKSTSLRRTCVPTPTSWDINSEQPWNPGLARQSCLMALTLRLSDGLVDYPHETRKNLSVALNVEHRGDADLVRCSGRAQTPAAIGPVVLKAVDADAAQALAARRLRIHSRHSLLAIDWIAGRQCSRRCE